MIETIRNEFAKWLKKVYLCSEKSFVKMYRESIKKLKEWKLYKNKKPLFFLGARQVGKTWLIQEFGNKEYRQMLYINFERADELRNTFLPDLNPKRLITYFITLQPMSFYEFLLAMGKSGLARILNEKLWDSLPSFSQKFNPQTAIRTSLSNYRKESWMMNIPLYIVGDYLTTNKS